jgi:hypothetical protein
VIEYSLFSSTGNLIDSFSDKTALRDALQRLVAAEPKAADDVALFISDERHPCRAITGEYGTAYLVRSL